MLGTMARGTKARGPVRVDEIMDAVRRALLTFDGRPISLDDTVQALSLVSFELKQASLKLVSEQEAARKPRLK
jgi:hypothetical protein